MAADYSDIDLVYLWLDFNDVWLKTATTEMIRSAQRAMPGINIIQISDQGARKHPLANSAMVFDKIVEQGEVAAFRGYAIAQHMLATERPAIICDVDLIWNNANACGVLSAMRGHVGLSPRSENAAMPYDTAVILAKPGHDRFWKSYQECCDALGGEPRAYGGDQTAIASHHVLQNGGWHDAEELVRAPNERPTSQYSCPALHFSAHRDWLVPYARLLDGGAPFEALMPGAGLDEIVYEEQV